MTLMLASVVDASEAALVLEGGADIVDFADSRSTSLGSLPIEAVAKAAKAVAGLRPVWAAVGEPPYEREALQARARALHVAGARAVRLAVDGASLDRLEPVLRALARDVGLVAVLFADRAPDIGLLPSVAAIGFKGALLEPAEKSGLRLLDHVAPSRLEAFCRGCREHGLASALAGSLQAPDVPRLLLVGPDILGFRGALCARGSRSGAMDPARVALIRDLIPPLPLGEGSGVRGSTLDPPGAVPSSGPPGHLLQKDGASDLVFVREVPVAAEIGAYAHERGKAQRLLFTVEAWVRRAETHVDDMRSVFSYDVILDAIRLVVGRGHVDFLETLAEEVAAIVLKEPRVVEARVRVEKLGVVEGRVGVEIRRAR